MITHISHMVMQISRHARTRSCPPFAMSLPLRTLRNSSTFVVILPIPAYHCRAKHMWRLRPSNTQKTNDKCYAKCVTKPSTSLSSSEEVRMYFWHGVPFRAKTAASYFFFALSFFSSHRLVFLAASTATWKPVS